MTPLEYVAYFVLLTTCVVGGNLVGQYIGERIRRHYDR